MDRTETRLKWIFPRLLRSVFPEWNPGRRDSPLNYMALGPLESVLDIELFKLALRHRCIGRIKQRAIGSWEHRGDKVLFPLVTEAIREAVEGPLSPFCLTWLGKKYSSNDTFACFGYAYSMLNRMSDCPLHVLNNPDIGDLAGGIELYFCIVFDSDMAYRGGSLLRIKKILRGMFNHRVLPHLAPMSHIYGRTNKRPLISTCPALFRRCHKALSGCFAVSSGIYRKRMRSLRNSGIRCTGDIKTTGELSVCPKPPRPEVSHARTWN